MNRQRLLPVLLLTLPLFLTGCVTATCERTAPVVLDTCPPWPVAGPTVAAELEASLPHEQAPATWEWLGRLSKLRDQLRICRGE